MSSLNQVVGHVGKEPDMREVNGVKKGRFSVAPSDDYKNRSGNWIKSTTWHNCVVWRHLANTVENYVGKGSKVGVIGRINNWTYTDKNGQQRYMSQIVANRVLLLDSRRNENRDQQQEQNQQKQGYASQQEANATPPPPPGSAGEPPFGEDDIPF